MKKCIHCGAENADDSRICIQCGELLEQPDEPEQPAVLPDETVDETGPMADPEQPTEPQPPEKKKSIFPALAALLAVCTMAAYRSRAQLSAGAAPRLTLYMQPGEEPLAAAGALVEALRLHETDTQQMNGAQPPEEAKHEE